MYLIPQKIQESGAKFSEEESRTVKKFILEGRLNGLDLAPRDFQHYNNTLSQIGQERAQFFGKVRVCFFLIMGIFCYSMETILIFVPNFVVLLL